ncbi:MAG: hypothetical protein J2P31_11350 [Blastocatellia bacterium]|nr:hypothetical protein [Blastocatellia bacterium]
MSDTREQIQELVRSASPEVQQVVADVLRLERDKLHLKLPRGIIEDITDLVKKAVK